MNYTKIFGFLIESVQYGVPLLFGAVGEILTEKVGNLNLGIPGIMYVGGISGILGGYLCETRFGTGNAAVCILCSLIGALVGAALMAFIYAFLTISLRANQNVTGLVLTTFGLGIGKFFGVSLSKILGTGTTVTLNATSSFYKKPLIPGLPFGFLVYLSLMIALIAALVLRKTKVGLNLRSIGESPASADAAGVNVERYKYLATVIGGAIAGLGGLFFVMDFMGGSWSTGGFDDRGWLAIALVIFVLWKPDLGIIGSVLFGGLYIVYNYIPGLHRASQEILKALPYLVTIAVLIITSIRKKRENMPPASLGLSYFREDR